MVPSAAISIVTGRSQSRRSADQAGGSNGTSMYGHEESASAAWRFASSPYPFDQVCGLHEEPVFRGQRGDAAATLDATREDDVRLDDVHIPADDEVTRFRPRPHHLAGGDAHARSPAQLGIRVGVLRRQRLLEPVGVEPLELAGEGRGGGQIPARRQVARHAPALVRVHHDLEVAAHGLPHRLDHGQVDAPVARVKTKLDGADAGIAQGDAATCPLLGGDELPARRVREEASAAASEQPPQGLVLRAADEIPDRDLERPVSTVVEVDRLADPVDDVGARRIDSDEKAFQELAVREGIPARVAFGTVVRADDDECRVLVLARHGIPGGGERRVERVAVLPRLDRGDAHHSPP